jgi:outer membrane lipoprotein carrier protein
VPDYFLVVLAFFFSLDTISPVARFEARYRTAKAMRANFLELYSENGQIVRSESGVAYFRKPGRMRWEYEKPEKNLFLVDGKDAWFYTPVDHTATKIPARQSDDWRTPLALLTEGAKLSKVCERVVAANLPPSADTNLNHRDAQGFECVLKNSSTKTNGEASVTFPMRVFLDITDTGELASVLIQSAGSVQTEFRFKDWEIDPPLADSLFHFSPPPGVVIVNGLLPSSPGNRQK